MMRNGLLLSAFLLISVLSKAQCPYLPCTCVDSSRISPYFICYAAYNPVCACNGQTFRSYCAAYNQGGINQYGYPVIDGPCGDWDFDFVPNPVIQGSTDPQYNPYGTLSIYSKIAPVTYLVQMYDVWGRVWYILQGVIGSANSVFESQPIYMDGFPQGIYILYVTINGESHYKKIIKGNLR